jgi:rhodanese-related sulfurtransferase
VAGQTAIQNRSLLTSLLGAGEKRGAVAVQEIATTDTISVTMLHHLRQRDPLTRILDVRTGGEFESAHIPSSYNVPLDTLVEHIDEFAGIDHPVVLVCQSGGRAGQAHKRLAAAGKTTLHVLDGGIDAWIAANGDLAHGQNQRWALDRQVRLMAGSVAIGSILVSKIMPRAKWTAAAVGAGLVYMAVTNSCPVSPYVAKLPYNHATPCDVDGVLEALSRVSQNGAERTVAPAWN